MATTGPPVKEVHSGAELYILISWQYPSHWNSKSIAIWPGMHAQITAMVKTALGLRPYPADWSIGCMMYVLVDWISNLSSGLPNTNFY